MKTLSISIHDENNLGDQVCNPTDYFDLPNVERVDAWSINWIYEPDNMVLGGGGMVHGLLANLIEYVPRIPSRKLIAWGLGHNQHGELFINYRNALNEFDLVGVRDFKTAHSKGWDYVPCASCMYPTFNAPPQTPEHRWIVYQHFDNPIKLRGVTSMMPTMTNEVGIFTALSFLASGEIVITNSYHGAYWAMLLGRRVLLYKPFTSRFLDFKYQPPTCDERTWKEVEALSAPVDYLEECRDLNRKFYDKVKAALGLKDSSINDGGATIESHEHV